MFFQEGLQMDEIHWSDFEKVVLLSGTIVSAEEFPEAKKAPIGSRWIWERKWASRAQALKSQNSTERKILWESR